MDAAGHPAGCSPGAAGSRRLDPGSRRSVPQDSRALFPLSGVPQRRGQAAGPVGKAQHGRVERQERLALPGIRCERAPDPGGLPSLQAPGAQEDGGEALRESRHHHNPHIPRRERIRFRRSGNAPALAGAAGSRRGLRDPRRQVAAGLRNAGGEQRPPGHRGDRRRHAPAGRQKISSLP